MTRDEKFLKHLGIKSVKCDTVLIDLPKSIHTGEGYTHVEQEYVYTIRTSNEFLMNFLVEKYENELADISQIQRYAIEGGSGYNSGTYFEGKAENGEWVKYQDLLKCLK